MQNLRCKIHPHQPITNFCTRCNYTLMKSNARFSYVLLVYVTTLICMETMGLFLTTKIYIKLTKELTIWQTPIELSQSHKGKKLYVFCYFRYNSTKAGKEKNKMSIFRFRMPKRMCSSFLRELSHKSSINIFRLYIRKKSRQE